MCSQISRFMIDSPPKAGLPAGDERRVQASPRAAMLPGEACPRTFDQDKGSRVNSRLLEGRVALITGAGSGIGRAAAELFAAEGAKVVSADINREGAEQTAGRVRESGGEATAVHVDVASGASVQAMISATLGAYGRLDCAVNNAGIIGAGGELHEVSEAEWDRVLGVNLRGVFLSMKFEIQVMLKQGRGAIVNTSSIAGLGSGARAAYGASKHGVIGLTMTASAQYAGRGIRVNAICPGDTVTPMMPLVAGKPRLAVPMARPSQPKEQAAAMLWLCSDNASYVTGHALPVDGGWTSRSPRT
jgi:NAD(P)-dependent dehydrogenase (short-subunit alcohol dehydrogenase family)